MDFRLIKSALFGLFVPVCLLLFKKAIGYITQVRAIQLHSGDNIPGMAAHSGNWLGVFSEEVGLFFY
jgi:hypothetical protein